jgi:hypothetical protein
VDTKKDPLALMNLTDFVAQVDAKTVTGSAERWGRRQPWRHPSGELLEAFWPNLDSSAGSYSDPALGGAARHFYSAYLPAQRYAVIQLNGEGEEEEQRWPPGPQESLFTLQTGQPIFTTLYFYDKRQNAGGRDWNAIVPPSNPWVKTSPKITPDASRAPSLPFRGVNWWFTITGDGSKSVTPMVNRLTTARSTVVAREVPLAAQGRSDTLVAESSVLPRPVPTQDSGAAPGFRRAPTALDVRLRPLRRLAPIR